MNQRRTILLGQSGQILDFYPPEWLNGVPASAATYAVFAVDAATDSAPDLTGTATADLVSTTFDAASGPAQATTRDVCHLTSVANIVTTRLYVARNADGYSELIQPVAIDDAGQFVTHQGPLDFDYAIGDTFKGFRQSFTLDATWSADVNNLGTSWRVRWTYAIAGTTYARWTFFDIARVSHHHNITALDIYQTRPDLQREQYGNSAKDWSGFIARAEKEVALDLRGFGVGWDQLRSEESDELVLSRAHWLIAEEGVIPEGRGDPESYVRGKHDAYRAALVNLKSRIDIDKGTSGGRTQRGAQVLTFGR